MRIFYGSDGVDSAFFHGKYVPFGRYWYQVEPDEAHFSFAHTLSCLAARTSGSMYLRTDNGHETGR